jgi:hypothetical protein
MPLKIKSFNLSKKGIKFFLSLGKSNWFGAADSGRGSGNDFNDVG